MWILPSRERPQNLKRLFDAWHKTKASTPVLLCLDVDDPCWPQYEEMEMPAGWKVFMGLRGPLSDIYNQAYSRHQNDPFFGFIADDVVPETEGWDRTLIVAAGKDGMAVPAGGDTTGGSPHFVLGGDLVRSVGWLSLPYLDRLYIDTVWTDIAKARGVYRYLPEVTLAHHHFSNGKALMDSTYRKKNKESDKALYESFKLNLETNNGYSS
jgi:hypothetical protein